MDYPVLETNDIPDTRSPSLSTPPPVPPESLQSRSLTSPLNSPFFSLTIRPIPTSPHPAHSPDLPSTCTSPPPTRLISNLKSLRNTHKNTLNELKNKENQLQIAQKLISNLEKDVQKLEIEGNELREKNFLLEKKVKWWKELNFPETKSTNSLQNQLNDIKNH